MLGVIGGKEVLSERSSRSSRAALHGSIVIALLSQCLDVLHADFHVVLERNVGMTALPRIDTTDPDQALTLCRDLLALIEAIAYDLTEDAAVESCDAVHTSVTIWNGVCLLTKLVKNTLTDLEQVDCRHVHKTESDRA